MNEPRERFDGISAMTQYTYMMRSMSSESEADTLIVLGNDTVRLDFHQEQKEDYDLDGKIDTHVKFTYFDDGRIRERYNLLSDERYLYEYDEQNRLLTEYSSHTKTTYTYEEDHPFWTTHTITDLDSGRVMNWRVRTFVK